jgi:predicted TIM-barrel fold metal-dependent hydrolase
MEYIKRGSIYFSSEVEDVLLPQVLALVGDGQLMFASDMPHGDRERFAAKTLQDRSDISEAAKTKILESNPAKFYRLPGF